MKLNPTAIVSLLAGSLALLTEAAAAKQTIITSVYSKASPQYKRSWESDGALKPEYYVIANGKYEPGTAPDVSIDAVKFPEIAGLVAEHLAKKGYHLAAKADGATLLLQVSWGTTQVFQDGNRPENLASLSSAIKDSNAAVAEYKQANEAAMRAAGPTAGVQGARQAALAANDALSNQLMRTQLNEKARDEQNQAVARTIGYVDELSRRNDISRFAGAGSTYDDLVSELESARYYVRVTAYDFPKLRQQNKQVVLWTTVVSVDAQNNRFDEIVAAMVANAGQQFGQGNGLVRQAQDGTVTLGELKFANSTSDQSGKDESKEKKKN